MVTAFFYFNNCEKQDYSGFSGECKAYWGVKVLAA
jgi:hypothetical protein